MPRLIDDLRATEKAAVPWCVAPSKIDAWAEYAMKLRELIVNPELPVLLIDNVADYYFRGSDQENWSLGRDFPNLAPPFEMFWTEHRLPSTIHSKQEGDSDVSRLVTNGRVGMITTALRLEDVDGRDIPSETRWLLWCDLFIDYGKPGIPAQGPHGAIFLAVDKDGAALGTPAMHTYSHPSLNEVMKSYMTWLHPTFLAVSFLHCKNVKVVENAVDKPLAKKYHARTGVHPARYKTLVIEPLKEILRTQGKSDSVGLARAMHICRGHFADYTEGRGLFGKYHGRFWIPATVRGTKRQTEKPPAREIEVKV